MFIRQKLALFCAVLMFTGWQLHAKPFPEVNAQPAWQEKFEAKTEAGSGTHRPLVQGHTIVCGNKQVSLDKDGTIVSEIHLSGNRMRVRKVSVLHAFDMIRKRLLDYDS